MRDNLKLISDLRKKGKHIAYDIRMVSFKSQMKRADKSAANYALILGEQELSEGCIGLKPLRSNDEQESIVLDELASELDDFSRTRVQECLESLECQAFLTAVSPNLEMTEVHRHSARVVKFGGSSVTGRDRADTIVDVTRAHLSSCRPVLVVSAFAKATATLERAALAAARHGGVRFRAVSTGGGRVRFRVLTFR